LEGSEDASRSFKATLPQDDLPDSRTSNPNASDADRYFFKLIRFVCFGLAYLESASFIAKQ
jgi:hypothetical protein